MRVISKFAFAEYDGVICHVCHPAWGTIATIGGNNCALV